MPHSVNIASEPSVRAAATRLTLTELAAGGEAVGRRDDGMVVFVPGGAPGEQVEVRIEESRKGFARARLLQVLSESVDRVEPACPLSHPERCGGCPLMHVSRAAQLRAKQAWVQRALRQTGAEVLPILAPTPELGYRVRARLVVHDGRLGFAGARSHRSVAVAACPVMDPLLEAALLGQGGRLAPLLGEGATLAGLVGRVPGTERRAVQLAVRLGRGGRRPAIRAFLVDAIEQGLIAGASLDRGEHGGGDDEILGAAALDVDVGDGAGPLLVAAAGFAQASAPGHTLLAQHVARAVADPAPASVEPCSRPRIVELYAGSGNLTRALRPVARSILAIEGDAAATARLRQIVDAAPSAALAPVEVQQAPVEQALAQLVHRGVTCDAVVLDPPRAGARPALRGIAALLPRRVVYVSCDAMTLGRDLVELQALGLRARRVQPIDLMPQTAEIECVAELERA
ncbi:MAG: TRAM domain-containing protein [Polyangia bacterium]